MATLEEPQKRRLQEELERTRRDLGEYADYSGLWRICLFQRRTGDEAALEWRDLADRCEPADETAAEAAAELRTSVLFDPTDGDENTAMRSILAIPILDPLIVDPSPLQQYVLGAVTLASGIPIETWTDKYELQMIGSNYAQRLAKGIIQ
jgi:hypothetical protein